MEDLRRQIGQANLDNTRDIEHLIDAAPSIQVALPNFPVRPDTNEVHPDTRAKPSSVDSEDKEENPFGNLDCHANEAVKDPFDAPPSPSNTTGDEKGDPSNAPPSPTCFIAPLKSVGPAHRGTPASATLFIPPAVSADESSKKGEDKLEQGPVFDSAHSDMVCAQELTPVGFIDITTDITDFQFGSPVFDSSIPPLPKFPSSERNPDSFMDILQPVTDAIESGKGDPVSAINNELPNASVENKQKFKDLMGQSFTLDDDPMGTSTLNTVIAEVDEIYRQAAYEKNIAENINEQGSMGDLSLKSLPWDEKRSHEIPTFDLFKTRSKRKGTLRKRNS